MSKSDDLTPISAMPTSSQIAPSAAVSKPKISKNSYLDYLLSIGMAFPQSFATALLTQPLYNAKIMQQTTSTVGGLNTAKALKELVLSQRSFSGIGLSFGKLAITNAIFNPCLVLADRSLEPEFVKENPFTAAFMKAALSTIPRVALTPIDTALTNKISSGMTTSELISAVEKCKTPAQKVGFLYRGATLEGCKNIAGLCSVFLLKDQLEHVKRLFLADKQANVELSAFDMVFAGIVSGTLKNLMTQPLDTVAKVQQSDMKAKTIIDAVNVLSERAIKSQESLTAVCYRGFSLRLGASIITTTGSLLMLNGVKIMQEWRDGKESGRDGGSLKC
jgi:hypothetical protein